MLVELKFAGLTHATAKDPDLVPLDAPPFKEKDADEESFVDVEDNKDDKMRRIAKSLEAGDVVEQVSPFLF